MNSWPSSDLWHVLAVKLSLMSPTWNSYKQTSQRKVPAWGSESSTDLLFHSKPGDTKYFNKTAVESLQFSFKFKLLRTKLNFSKWIVMWSVSCSLLISIWGSIKWLLLTKRVLSDWSQLRYSQISSSCYFCGRHGDGWTVRSSLQEMINKVQLLRHIKMLFWSN